MTNRENDQMHEKIEPTHNIDEYITLEKQLRKMHINYRRDLEKARLSKDRKTIIRILKKQGINDLLDKFPSPISPSTFFHDVPFPPFPQPGPPDPKELGQMFEPHIPQIPPQGEKYIFGTICDFIQHLSVDPKEFIC